LAQERNGEGVRRIFFHCSKLQLANVVVRAGVQNQRDDEPVETENLGENEDENHSNKELRARRKKKKKKSL